MPVYEYQCAKCDEKFEAYLKRDDEQVACPKCRAKRVRRLFSVFGPSPRRSGGGYGRAGGIGLPGAGGGGG